MVDHNAAVAFPMGDLRPHGVPGAVVAGLRKGIEELVAVLDKPFQRRRVAHDLSLVEQKRLRLEPLAHEHVAHDAYVFHSLADVGEHPAVLGGDKHACGVIVIFRSATGSHVSPSNRSTPKSPRNAQSEPSPAMQ